MTSSEQSEIYSPELSGDSNKPEQPLTYKRRVQKTTQFTIEGKWTEQQNTKYILFMDYHSKIFSSKQKRKQKQSNSRSARIFKTLSKILGTRTARQCRSHFQKIMNKFKRVSHVKLFYQNQLGAEQYQRQFQLLVNQLKQPDAKLQECEKNSIFTMVSVQVQTDPLNMRLHDLPNGQIIKLMHLLQEYQKTQAPFLTGNPLFTFDIPKML